MYYAQARWYDPVNHRFASEDPAGSGLNLFTFAGGDQVNGLDPTGMVDCPPDNFDTVDCNDAPPTCGWVSLDCAAPLGTIGVTGTGTNIPQAAFVAAEIFLAQQLAAITSLDDAIAQSGAGGGGGGGPGVSKQYGLSTACSSSASQLMGAVESNFPRFGNYSRWGGLESVTFSPPVGMGPGSTIPISVGIFGVSQSLSVTVQSMSAQSMTFTTNPGHLLYPAFITFAASNGSRGSINFNINLGGTVASPLKFYFGGSSFEDAQWNHFLGQVGAYCKAGH